MGVFFEEYSKKPSRVARQGAALVKRVRREPWLKFAHPSVSAKYTGLLEAMGHAWEEAWNQNDYYRSHILRENDEHGAVIGQSMLIPNQTVRHPIEGVFEGTLVNYWLAANSSRTAHHQAARVLIGAAGALMLQQNTKAEELPVLTVVSAADMWPPRGLGFYLEPIGEPCELSVPTSMSDLYHAPSGTRYLQLYYGDLPLWGDT